MSQAFVKRELVMLPDGTYYCPFFTCPSGQVKQEYTATKVSPDWEADPTKCPVLQLHVIASQSTSGEVIPSYITLFYDGEQLTLNPSSGENLEKTGVAPAQMFLVSGGPLPLVGDPCPWTIKIQKNIAKAQAAVQAGHTLKVLADMPDGQKVWFEIPFVVGPLSETGVSLDIVCDDPVNAFVVDENDSSSSTTLRAQVNEGGNPLTTPTGYTFQWYRWGTPSSDSSKNESFDDLTESGATYGWVKLGNSTGVTLAVSPGEVDFCGRFGVRAKKGNKSYFASCSVMDIGDPYFGVMTVKDESGADSDDQFPPRCADTAQRKYTAKLYSRETSAVVTFPVETYWTLQRPDGTSINSNYNTANHKDTFGVVDSSVNVDHIEIPASWMRDNQAQVVKVLANLKF